MGNVMNHFDNQVAFNDGYHITHHAKPYLHWTEMPFEFLTNLEKYAEHDPVVIDRTGFFDVGFNLIIRAKFDPDGAWKWLIERFELFISVVQEHAMSNIVLRHGCCTLRPMWAPLG